MGLFNNIKAQIQAATEMAAQARAAAPMGQTSTTMGGAPTPLGGPPSPPPGIAILNPTPQDEVDRLLDAGGDARGVVLGSRHDMTGISTARLSDELSPRFDEAKRRHKSGDLDTGLEGITQLPGLLKETFGRGSASPAPAGLSAHDPALAPIGGVTWQQFIAVRAEVTTRPSPEGFDAVAQRHGVPAGAWNGVDAAWMQRVMTTPALVQQMSTDLEDAQRALKGR